MKGQSRVFEQVLLFGIGVAIFVSSFAIFQMYQTEYTLTASDDQIRGIRDLVYNHITEMTINEDLNSSIVIKIPKQIGGEGYSISVDDDDLTVRMEKSGKLASTEMTSLSMLYSFSGETRSSGGEIIIYKRDYNIIIE
ncbi:MAG: hypothetical protein JW789_02280 [Candidatus Aenigmarchaeota archaeon]|nr:hypothetical protein [Candidatus Aenigmarchaeota archaeon]